MGGSVRRLPVVLAMAGAALSVFAGGPRAMPAPPGPGSASPAPRGVGSGRAAASSSATPAAPVPARWCAPELEELPSAACVVVPPHPRDPLTVAIFLHGVIAPETGWQWAQQRAAARAATAQGLVALLPRGRRGYGPRGMEDWWTWPTSARAQAAIEGELLAEWDAGRAELERRLGRPFSRYYLFGFSNGAYYASSLALRGLAKADGIGVFAGGTRDAQLLVAARKVTRRPPIYVGYGTADSSARADAAAFGDALRALGWPSRVVARPGVGHTMTDSMVTEALTLFAAP
jgi:predicted esterase